MLVFINWNDQSTLNQIKMKKLFYLLLVAVMISTACQPKTKTVDTKAEIGAIRNLEDQWTLALQTGDVEKIIGFFLPDVVQMRPNSPISVGPQAIRKNFEIQLADSNVLWKTYAYTIDNIEVSASGDLACARGTERISIKTPNGLVDDMGKWVDIWKKIDGQWKVIVCISNNDKPLSAPQTSTSLVEEFTKIEEGWNEAWMKKDVKALDLLYATEYIHTDENGKLINKKQDIDDVASGSFKFLSPSVLSDIKVNLYGNMAVVNGINSMKATYNGKDISGKYRFTDVFVKRDGRWQCVSSQASVIPK
jgi:ketosteroid isomerase-like protein